MSARLGRIAAFSSFIGIAQRCLQIGVTLLIMPSVMSALGKSSFGIWAAAVSLTWMAGTADLGIGNALITDLSRAFASNGRDYVKRLLTTALWLGLMIAAFEIIGSLILIPHLAPSGSSDAFMIAAVCMALNVPVSFATSLWAAEQKLYMVWIWEAAQTLVTAVLMWCAVSLTKDLRFYVAISAGVVFAASSASMAHFLFTHSEFMPSPRFPSLADMRALLRRGAPYLILSVGLIFASYSDNIIALSILGGDATAIMAVSQRLYMTALGLLFVLSQPLWPAFANAAVREDITWVKKNFWFSTSIVMTAALLGSAVLVVLGGELVTFWLGGRLLMEPEIFWGMAISIIITTLGRIPDMLLNALGIVWFQVKVAIVYGILAFGLKLCLAHNWGVPGILVATGIAYAFTHLPAYLWWVRAWMRRTEQD